MNAYAMLGRYNQWANGRAYEAAAALGDEALRADCGAAFVSVLGTLNHLVVTDRIWMGRFTGRDYGVAALDATVSDDLAELRRIRTALDDAIIAYADSVTDADLARTITFQMVSRPQRVTQRLLPSLTHFFNHQTHHRGQIHAMLTRLTGAAPAFDLLLYDREVNAAA